MTDELYVLMDTENYVIGWSNFPTPGYTKVNDYDGTLPHGLGRGWVKYVNEEFKIDEETKRIILNSEVIEWAKSQVVIEGVEKDLTKISLGSNQTNELLAIEMNNVIQLQIQNEALRNKNESIEMQLANESFNSIQLQLKSKQLEDRNETLQIQLANEALSNIKLEARVSALEKKGKGE